jgi:hypothetical protein
MFENSPETDDSQSSKGRHPQQPLVNGRAGYSDVSAARATGSRATQWAIRSSASLLRETVDNVVLSRIAVSQHLPKHFKQEHGGATRGRT